jgi:hypothetical protein
VCLVGVESPDVAILEYKTQGELQLYKELYSVVRNSVRVYSTLSSLYGSDVSDACSCAGHAHIVHLVSAFQLLVTP